MVGSGARCSPAGPASGQGAEPVVSCESLAKLELREATVTMAATVAAGRVQGARSEPRRSRWTWRAGPRTGPGAGLPRPEVRARGNAVAVWIVGRDPARLLPGRRDDEAQRRLRHQDGSLAAAVGLEREVLRGRQLRLGRTIIYDGLLLGREERLCRGQQRYRTLGPGGVGRFALGHPDKVVDYGYRANHEMTLQARRSSRPSTASAQALLLGRLFAGRTTGNDGGAAFPERLRRRRRRSAGQSHHPFECLADLARPC